jgi:protein SCO1/2
MSKSFKAGILIFLIGIPAFVFMYLDTAEAYAKVSLKKFIVVDIDSTTKDTIYHTVPDYSFINQNNQLVDSSTYGGKIQVVDFKFTSCESICPTMTSNMVDVYSVFFNDPDLIFISFTVDPDRDTPEVLKEYQESYKIKNENWHFVTGIDTTIYKLARQGFFISGYYDDNVKDFVHSEKVILVDKSRVIRGFYDATDEEEVERLKIEIKVLKKEYEQQEN